MDIDVDPKRKLREVVRGRGINLDDMTSGLESGLTATETIQDMLSTREKGAPRAESPIKPPVRADPSQLGLLYITDAVTYTIIRRYTRALVSAGYYFEDAAKETLDDWTRWGKKIRLKRALWRAVRHAFVYGNGYVEIVQGKETGKVVKLFNIHPESMDFKRDNMGQIKTDEFRDPVGYVQKITYGDKRDKPIAFDKIFLLKVDELGDSFEGISPLEPVYKPGLIRLNIEEHMGESSFRHANPVYVCYIGDEMHEPTIEEIDLTAGELTEIDERSIYVFPYYYKLEKIPGETSSALKTYMDHFIDMICAGLDYPRVLIVPTNITAEAVERQVTLWEESIEEYQEFLEEQVEDSLLERVGEIQGWKIPKFKFKRPRRLINKVIAQTLAQYVRVGLIQPDKKLEEFIRKLEVLPVIDEETHPQTWDIEAPGRSLLKPKKTGEETKEPEKKKEEPKPKKLEKKDGLSNYSRIKNILVDNLAMKGDIVLRELDLSMTKENRALVSNVRYKLNKDVIKSE